MSSSSDSRCRLRGVVLEAHRGSTAGPSRATKQDELILVPTSPDGSLIICDTPGFASVMGITENLLCAFDGSGNTTTLDRAIDIHREIINGCDELHSDPQLLSLHLSSLARALLMRYGTAYRLVDLEDALASARRALSFASLGTPSFRAASATLAECALARFSALETPIDLQAALLACASALRIQSPLDAYYLRLLTVSGVCHTHLYRQKNAQPDLDIALRFLREAVHHTDEADPLLPCRLDALAEAVALGPPSGIPANERPTDLHRRALHLCPARSPRRFTHLYHVGRSLHRDSRAVALLTESVALFREALRLCPANTLPHRLIVIELGYSLRFLFQATGDTAYLDEAFTSLQQVVQYEHGGVLPPGPRLTARHNFVASLARRYESSGSLGALEAALALARENFVLARTAPAQIASGVQSALGNLLRMRWEHLRNADDARQAVDVARTCVEYAPPHALHRPNLENSLGWALLAQYEVSKSAEDLDAAIRTFGHALEGARPTLVPIVQGNLAGGLQKRFKLAGDIRDLERSIELSKRNLELRPQHHHYYPIDLRHCAGALLDLYRTRRNPAVLDEARKTYVAALELLPAGHVERVSCEIEMASLELVAGYVDKCLAHLQRGVDDVHASAAERLTQALSVLREIEAACALLRSEHEPLLCRLYGSLVHLLPHVAHFSLALRPRLAVLREADGLPLAAAALALRAGAPERAVELLEQGRSIFWSHMLRLRGPPDEMPEEVKREMEEIRWRLEHGGYTGQGVAGAACVGGAPSRCGDVERFDALVSAVRARPGLERFLLHEEFEALAHVADEGPVVILNHTSASSHAIIIRKGARTAESIALPSVEDGWVLRSSGVWRKGRNSSLPMTVDMQGFEEISEEEADNEHRAILQELWVKVVKPILDALQIEPSKGRSRPRIWWCPTGRFTFLPLHAAGVYAAHGDACSDYVVSSYTPTLGALLEARRKVQRISVGGARVLLGAVPYPCALGPQWEDIPSTIDEIAHVAQVLPPQSIMDLPAAEDVLRGGQGVSAPTLLAHLLDAHVVHLASHAFQNAQSPLDGGFIMRDKLLTISELMQLPLPGAFLAYLSACETAKGDAVQIEQTIHLAATMLFAGFKSVVATLWTMGDEDGPVVARAVYQELFRKETEFLDPNAIPYALDDAVQRLRAEGALSARWAPYIHLGI